MTNRNVKRKLAAIRSADEEGCGRLMSDDKVWMKHKYYFELKGGMACESL
jgi:ketosteroid isomerase-like protein